MAFHKEKINSNFWEVHPLKKTYFNSIYSKDKSKGKQESSDLMWAMYLCYHWEGEYVNLKDHQKIKTINSLFKTTSTDILEKIQPHLEAFYDLEETPVRRTLREWNEKMLERAKFIKETPYSPDYEDEVELRNGETKTVLVKGTHKMLDDMLKANDKLYEAYFDILKKLNMEEDTKQGESGAELSLSERGLI